MSYQIEPLDKFMLSYIETALWSSLNDEGEPLDRYYSIDDISDEQIDKLTDECKEFRQLASQIDDSIDDNFLAHDFWLTRNRHGAGFWDGDYRDDVGDKLTKLSHKFGELTIVIGDDNKLYFER